MAVFYIQNYNIFVDNGYWNLSPLVQKYVKSLIDFVFFVNNKNGKYLKTTINFVSIRACPTLRAADHCLVLRKKYAF